MYRKLRSRSVHLLGTGKKRTTAQWRLPEKACFARTKHQRSPLRSGSLFARTQKRPDLDLSLLYILILRTYTKFVWKNKMLAVGVCLPQFCSSTGRRFALSKSRLQYYRRIVSFPQKKSIKCVVNWTPLRIRIRWKNTQPHLYTLTSLVPTSIDWFIFRTLLGATKITQCQTPTQWCWKSQTFSDPKAEL